MGVGGRKKKKKVKEKETEKGEGRAPADLHPPLNKKRWALIQKKGSEGAGVKNLLTLGVRVIHFAKLAKEFKFSCGVNCICIAFNFYIGRKAAFKGLACGKSKLSNG